MYSGTSLNLTPQIKDAIEKTSIIRTKILVTTGLVNTFLPLKENLYILQQVAKILGGPKMSTIERFHSIQVACMHGNYIW